MDTPILSVAMPSLSEGEKNPLERSNGAVRSACDIQVDGKGGPGRPNMTWKQLREGSQRVEALVFQPS